MSHFGVFANLVATAGSLVAAATALRLGWMQRASWLPPVEAVPEQTAKLAGLGSSVVVALLYAFTPNPLDRGLLAMVAALAFFLALASLGFTIYLSVTQTFMLNGKKILGGFRLTSEAQRIRKKHGQTEQEMLDDVHRLDRVWTLGSMAAVQICATMAFIGLIVFGTTTIAAAADLVAVFASSQSDWHAVGLDFRLVAPIGRFSNMGDNFE